MAKYAWRFDAACTVYHKPASWQTNSYDNAWVSMATSKYNTSPVFGITSHTPSGLICATTILESNALTMKISNTSLLPYALTYEIVEDWAGNLCCSIIWSGATSNNG
jgi:hypothetical protein